MLGDLEQIKAQGERDSRSINHIDEIKSDVKILKNLNEENCVSTQSLNQMKRSLEEIQNHDQEVKKEIKGLKRSNEELLSRVQNTDSLREDLQGLKKSNQ